MFDRRLIAIQSRLLAPMARRLAARNVSADSVTLVGFGVGLVALPLLAASAFLPALAAILANRLLDGLDGAVARLRGPTDRGAFLDIALDFFFYGSVPLGFALADPEANALPAAVLLLSFIGTGSSFLAFAAISHRRGTPRRTLSRERPAVSRRSHRRRRDHRDLRRHVPAAGAVSVACLRLRRGLSAHHRDPLVVGLEGVRGDLDLIRLASSPTVRLGRCRSGTTAGEDKRHIVGGHLNGLAETESSCVGQALEIGNIPQTPGWVARLQRLVESGVRGGGVHAVAHEGAVEKKQPPCAEETAGACKQSQTRFPWRDMDHVDRHDSVERRRLFDTPTA